MDAARFRHYDGLRVALEAPIADSVRTALTGLGHNIIVMRGQPYGGSQAIIKLPRGYMAGSDPRKDGYAGGY
jgi:gamma-glutamyltranspeptidase/glutathione hydrolase